MQDPEEFQAFLQFISTKNITSYLEIGVARGDTFHAVVSTLPAGSRALAVDYPQQQWGLDDSRLDLLKAIDDLREKGYDAQVIFGDSKASEIIDRVREHDMFDLCFIDGDHSFDGVSSDYDNYGLFSTYCAFHDIADPGNANNRGEVIEVKRFWEHLKARHIGKHYEFISDIKFPMGIGVIC